MIAGLLKIFGIYMGDDFFTQDDTPGSTYEDIELANKRPEEIKHLIDRNNNKHSVWGFKSPNARLWLDDMRDALRNPKFILVYRDIPAVFDSLNRRGLDEPFGFDTVAEHYLLMGKFHENNKDICYAASYEHFVLRTDQALKDLSEFLGIDLDTEVLERSKKFIEPGGYRPLP